MARNSKALGWLIFALAALGLVGTAARYVFGHTTVLAVHEERITSNEKTLETHEVRWQEQRAIMEDSRDTTREVLRILKER